MLRSIITVLTAWQCSCRRHLDSPSIVRLLLDTLQHSILSLWLRTTQVGIAPTCFQTISSTHVDRLVTRRLDFPFRSERRLDSVFAPLRLGIWGKASNGPV